MTSTTPASAAEAGPPAGPRRGRPAWEWVGLAVVAVGLVGLAGYPLAELVRAAAAEGATGVVDALRGVGEAVANTLWTSAVATVAALAIGTAGALITERAPVPARGWLRLGMLLPLLIPPFVSALSWNAAYGTGGVVARATGVALPGLFGPLGVVAVITVSVVPLAYLLVAAALSGRAEPDLDRAARASGATWWTTLRTVTLPLLRPPLVAASALVFVSGVNNFGIPAVLGIPAGFETMTTRIYSGLVLGGGPAAFSRVLVLALALVVIAMTAVGVTDTAASSAPRTGAPAGGPASTGAPRRSFRLAAAAWTYVAVTSVVPFVALLLIALTRGVGVPPVPANWTLANFSEALAGPALGALGRTLFLAVTAATVLVLLGGLAAALGRVRSRRRLATLTTLAFAIPGSALAVAVLLAYGRWLADTLAIILVVYLGKFWALGHRPIAGSADRLPDDLYRAARAAGARATTALRSVVVPLVAPALGAAWLLVFLFGLHELTMSSLLHGPGRATLAVVVLNLQQLGDPTVTAALAVGLTLAVVLGGLPLLAARRLVIWLRGP